jgi:hypothetical protein
VDEIIQGMDAADAGASGIALNAEDPWQNRRVIIGQF